MPKYPLMRLGVRGSRMLLADWFVRLARDFGIDLQQTGGSNTAYTLGDPIAFHVTAQFADSFPFLTFVASDSRPGEVVAKIASAAIEKLTGGDFGGIVWYSVELHESDLRLSPFSLLGDLLQRLGSQVRIAGWRRLGANILLEFTEEMRRPVPHGEDIFAPKAVVRVHIAAPGPCAGFLASEIAHGVVESAGAICSFALGRPVDIPFSAFPAKSEQLLDLAARQRDVNILTLARGGIPLDIVNYLAVEGGAEVFLRARNALLSFDAAGRQERDSVAGILYVVAAECISSPTTPWKDVKLTKRFIEFFDELMPSELDRIVGHDNFEEAFGIVRGGKTARVLRRKALNRFYDFRSGQLHQGLSPSYQSLGTRFDPASQARRGLLRDFAEGAILRYLSAPRSSLIGHPGLDRSVSTKCGQ